MKQPTLELKQIGQIDHANITFGDLTVLVGPQATGKSISLQLLRLLLDYPYILNELKRFGLDWSGNVGDFLDVYLGEGMRRLWRANQSTIMWRGNPVDLSHLVNPDRWPKAPAGETVYYIPAQRVLTLRDGWPRPFTDYAPGDPFAVRAISENLRLVMEKEFTVNGAVFPQKRWIKHEIRELLQNNLFPGYSLRVERNRSQRRLVLQASDIEEPLPFMVWSAGQREFVPLLLGFYWLMTPAATTRREKIEWVIIEELEMGLHPQAISVMMLMVLELLSRGYRVCLSTHSPHVLDVVWALQTLKEYQADPRLVLQIFQGEPTPAMLRVAQDALDKIMHVYYFDRAGRTHDISQLDPGSADDIEAGWGGVAEFSGRVANVVAQAVANTPAPA